MYKLIATDLDGTLLNSNSEIPELNLRYIKKALEHGIKIAICSGRSFLSLEKFEQKLGLCVKGSYGIGFNGAMIYDAYTREIVKEVKMKNDFAMKIVEKLKQFPEDIDVLMYESKNMFAEKTDGRILEYSKLSGVVINRVESLCDVKKDISKVLVKSEPETLAKLEKYMNFFIFNGEKCNMFFSHNTLLEFTHLNATKGQALCYLANYLNIDIKDVIAVGDNFNDISMIECAGLGVAVKNAEHNIKKYAKYITNASNDEGALKEVIEKFVLSDLNA